MSRRIAFEEDTGEEADFEETRALEPKSVARKSRVPQDLEVAGGIQKKAPKTSQKQKAKKAKVKAHPLVDSTRYKSS